MENQPGKGIRETPETGGAPEKSRASKDENEGYVLDEIEDDLVSDSGDEEDSEIPGPSVRAAAPVKETSSRTIRALVAIIRMLVESPKISCTITVRDIANAAYAGTTLTDQEKQVAATIAIFLRPYVPRRAETDKLPQKHILTVLLIPALSNEVSRIVGMESRVNKLTIETSSKWSLFLSTDGLFKIMRDTYDIPTIQLLW
ncbi:hypothetical protein DFQ28_004120, partial [Apophysomyces sp. BC1034]